MNMRRAVFLDRDGVLNARRFPVLRRARDLVLLPGAPEAAAKLSRAGFALAMVTNQEWVQRGVIPRAEHDLIQARILAALEEAGAKMDRVYVAFTRAEAKPLPTLLRRAQGEMGVDMARSFMVGDNRKDMVAGRAAGCRTVLVDPRFRTRWQRAHLGADHVARDLPAAAEWLLEVEP